MNFQQAKLLLQQSREFILLELEKTIFSVGGRGYYENPTTDMLAFFMDPNEDHELGGLMLESFINSLGINLDFLQLTHKPLREVVTDNNKRIDLLLQGNDWVIVVENKIYHQQNNPFTEYEEYVKKYHRDKKAYFVILSPSGVSEANRWKPISYKKLIDEVKANLDNYLISHSFNKWTVYLRDFLLTLEQITVRKAMDNQAINFIEENYYDVTQLSKLRDQYLKHIETAGLAMLKEAFSSKSFTTAINLNKDGNAAVKFFLDNSPIKSDVTIFLDKNGNLFLRSYFYNIPENQQHLVKSFFCSNTNKRCWTEQKTICGVEVQTQFQKFDDLMNDFKSTVEASISFLEQEIDR